MALTETYPVHKIGTREMIAVPFSFETGEVGEFKLDTLPYRCKVVAFQSVLLKAAGSTNAGTIKLKKSTTELAEISIAADSAYGVEDEDTSITDHYFDTTDQISLTTAKSTAGGKGIVYLTVEVLPTHLS